MKHVGDEILTKHNQIVVTNMVVASVRKAEEDLGVLFGPVSEFMTACMKTVKTACHRH